MWHSAKYTQHNATQYSNPYAKCRYAECRNVGRNETFLKLIQTIFECKGHYAEWHYAGCHYVVIMLSVIMLSVIMLSVIMLSIIMLSVIS